MKELRQFLKDAGGRVIYPQMGGMGLALTDYTMYEVYGDSEKQLEISLKIEETFPTDFTYPVDFGTVFLHDLGIPLLMPKRDFFSSLENPIKTREALDRLRYLGDRKFSCGWSSLSGEPALMPVYLDSIEKIARRIQKPEMVALPGPFTLAAELTGITDLAKYTIKKPEMVRDVLEFTADLLCWFATEAAERGAGLIQVSEPTAVILSPSMFAKWVTPGLCRVLDCINGQAWSALHICGDTTAYLDEMISAKPMVLSLDQIMDMEATAGRMPEDIVAAGNTDPIGVMLQGTPEQVEDAVSALLAGMEKYENFMPSFGCDCPISTPLENMRSFIETVYRAKQKMMHWAK